MTKILVDPLDYHIPNRFSEITILGQASLLTHWISHCPNTKPLMECLKENYHHGWYPWSMDDYELSPSGVYSAKDDPDLLPLLKYERENEEVFLFEYDIVAMRGEYGTIVCRLD